MLESRANQVIVNFFLTCQNLFRIPGEISVEKTKNNNTGDSVIWNLGAEWYHFINLFPLHLWLSPNFHRRFCHSVDLFSSAATKAIVLRITRCTNEPQSFYVEDIKLFVVSSFSFSQKIHWNLMESLFWKKLNELS